MGPEPARPLLAGQACKVAHITNISLLLQLYKHSMHRNGADEAMLCELPKAVLTEPVTIRATFAALKHVFTLHSKVYRRHAQIFTITPLDV